jgi:hypothetical protein
LAMLVRLHIRATVGKNPGSGLAGHECLECGQAATLTLVEVESPGCGLMFQLKSGLLGENASPAHGAAGELLAPAAIGSGPLPHAG